MIGDVLLADLLNDVVGAPELAVEEDDAFRLCLCAVCTVTDHFLIQAVADLGLIVISAVAERDLVKGINDLAVDVGELTVEEIVIELCGAVIGACIEVKALLCGRTGPCTVHPDADACGIGRLALFKDGDVSRALPLSAFLRIVCRMIAAAEHHHSAAAGFAVDLALDVNALFVVKEIVRIGDQRDDAHIHRVIVLRIADEVGLGCDIGDIAACIDCDRADDHRLVNGIGRSRVAVCDIGNRGINIRLRGFVIDLDRTGIPGRGGRRIAAVERVVDRRAGLTAQRQIEAAGIEAAVLREGRLRNDDLLDRAGRIGAARGQLVQNREGLAAVRDSAECGIIRECGNVRSFQQAAVGIGEHNLLAVLGKAEVCALDASALADAAVNGQIAVAGNGRAGRNRVAHRICFVIGDAEAADIDRRTACVVEFHIIVELTVRCCDRRVLGADLIDDDAARSKHGERRQCGKRTCCKHHTESRRSSAAACLLYHT